MTIAMLVVLLVTISAVAIVLAVRPAMAATADPVRPLSRDRVKAALRSRAWTYQSDRAAGPDGPLDLGTTVRLLVTGESKEILVVRGSWEMKLPTDQYAAAQSEANDWNRDRWWPKAFVRMDDLGWVQVNTELVMDYEHGLTDAQLRQHIDCAVTGTGQVFQRFARRFQTENRADDLAW